MLTHTSFKTAFGSIAFAATDKGLVYMVMTGKEPEHAERRLLKECPDSTRDDRVLPRFRKQLRDYFAGRKVRFDVEVDLSSMTDFQRKVLHACADIDYGKVATYGELARMIGKPRAARAVGAALGRNPFPLVIPCHRIIASDGRLCGFSAEQGVNLKKRLLELEQQPATIG